MGGSILDDGFRVPAYNFTIYQTRPFGLIFEKSLNRAHNLMQLEYKTGSTKFSLKDENYLQPVKSCCPLTEMWTGASMTSIAEH